MDKTEEIMRYAAKSIEEYFPDMAFILLVFEFGDNKIGNYISNAERKSMIKVLRETADRLEFNQDIPATEGSA